MTLSTLILAAGQGKRMHSDLPKVLHRLAGKPLLEHVVQTARTLDTKNPPIVVYGHQGERVKTALDRLPVTWVEQTEQLGTAHAVKQAIEHVPMDGRVLILYGDVPLIETGTLKKFMAETPPDALGIITANLPDPTGFGRIIRNNKNQIISIVEEKDATEKERAVTEINTGIYLVSASHLQQWLPKITNHNAQQEFYLTDLIALAVKEKMPIYSMHPARYEEILGINDRLQLACLERFYQERFAEKLMLQGVTLLDPHRFDARGDMHIAADVVIDINVILEGQVKIGKGCVIGPHVLLRNVVLGDHVIIQAHSVLDGAEISDHCIIGPFARLRPGSVVAKEAHVGNFVEIKNSRIGTASKVNHLSYIGDSEIGQHVNIGAGTITCNYDGMNKHKTVIGDYAFIGSNTELVAPVTIGEHATIGAGSTITRNAPAHQLTLCRGQQRTIENWQRPGKKEKET
ncbi:MAG TPA: bifunctional UDP-N-acetylglucosamine diphosphorylase/glucosamine-1-phosphate N-acetyltransferase GlmU [Gammaproteobacteria bacterium]|nr:bifunctional UDP-N-acetylglucosamine diphosphorylase/glucosamine-1-phosphate N-acetyltransferase GlmU [Gammaproteobacteria bacterium]